MPNKIHSIALVFVGLLFSVAAADVSTEALVRLEQDKANIISLIRDGDYAGAQTLTQKLLADFPQDTALPQALFEIAERYRWSNKSDKYECAKGLYQQIVQNYPDSPVASKAQLGIAKVNVLSLIVAQDFDGAEEALDEMVADFQNDPNLADELYWIGRGYGYWERHEEEKAIYQQIVEKYPDSPFAGKAQLGFSRAAVQAAIMSQDYDGAKKAFEKLTADFSGHKDLHDTLYWIAERYAWSGRFEEAKRIHQQIIQNYPDSSLLDKARLGLSRANVLSLVTSQDYDKAEEGLDKMIADFSGGPDLPKAVMSIGEQCYKQGLAEEKQGLTEQAKIRYEKAAEIWEGLQDKFPDSSLIPEACGWTGDCYIKLGRYEESIRCFQKVVDSYPEYKHAGHAQYMVGRCYEELKNTGALEESIADTHTKAAYEQVVLNYPDCPAITHVNSWLSHEAEVEKEE